MKELAVLLVVLIVGTLTVTNTQLADFQAPRVPTMVPTTPVVLPMPRPTLGPGPVGVLDVAMQWLGTPYLWGGCTRRGVDCSCFVQNVLATVGIHAPRTTVQQIAWATPLSREQLQVGDLVFFNNTCIACGPNPTHVGMYIGGGLMINAGDPVQIAPAFNSNYAGAGRPH